MIFREKQRLRLKCFRQLFFLMIFLGIASSAYAIPFTIENLRHLHPQYVDLPDGKLEYYRFGSGTPIVLIAGYATSVSSWNRHFLTMLARQHEVIIFDNRNVGGSHTTAKDYTISNLADDTYALIHQLGLNKPAVLGISMGGMIAQQLALLHPSDVGALILINTAMAGKAIPPAPDVEEVILNTPKGRLRRYVLALRLLAPVGWRLRMAIALASDHFQPENQIEMGVSTTTLQKQQQLVLAWSTNNEAAQRIAQINLPTLILSGGSDVIIPPQNSDLLAETIPNAKLYRWKDGGHAMIYQHPFQLAEVINEFLSNETKTTHFSISLGLAILEFLYQKIMV